MRGLGRSARWAAAGVALALAGAPALARGEIVVFPVPEPFRIGEQVYPPGDLSVRFVAEFTPSRSIHDIRVGEERLGMLLVQRGRGEAPTAVTVAVFQRGPDGLLSLVGYAMPDGRTGTSYRVAVSSAAPPASATPGSGTVFVAAR